MRTLWKRILKWIGWLAGGAITLVVTLYLLLLLINLRDQPPSEFALRLEEIYRNRPTVADADNGYIYLMGFSAAPDADPYEAGLRRLEWLRHRAEHPGEQTRLDPLQSYQSPHSPAAEQILRACGGWGTNQCETALEQNNAALPEWFATEQWRVDRYRTLLARSAWLETLPPDPNTPWPGYAPAMEAQRLLLAKAHYLGGQKDANGVREILEQDARFWRVVLAASDTLITRMIAAAALGRHFNMGNLALRRLPAELQLAAMPETWRAALSDDELSWHRSFTGEWVYGQNSLRQIMTEHSMPAAVGLEDPGLLSRAQQLAMRPLFQRQDTTNQSARMFARAADALQVPIERFSDAFDAAKTIFDAPAGRLGTFDDLYNPIGDLLAAMGSGTLATYPPRVADIEGARRAAVLATELRSRKVSAANIATELAASDFRVPYTGAAFLWDAEAQSIVFIGLASGERGQHSFKY